MSAEDIMKEENTQTQEQPVEEVTNLDNYVCPYCGKKIAPDQVLFWEQGDSKTDSKRARFLTSHGLAQATRASYPRRYFTQSEDTTVTKIDGNNYPLELTARPSQGMGGDELDDAARARKSSFDDEEDDDDDFFGMGGPKKKQTAATAEDNEPRMIPNRACPFCHCNLPKKFGVMPVHHVAMFGGRAAGKTAYIINLFQKISQGLSSNNMGAVVIEQESRDFLKYITDRYLSSGHPDPTPTSRGLMPILFEYNYKGENCYIDIYDIAGEATGDASYMANHIGIARCEAIMLMIDPNMFCDGRYFNEMNSNDERNEGQVISETGNHDFCSVPIDEFLAQAGYLCTEYATNVKSVICVVTKLDMLLTAEKASFSAGQIEITQDCGQKHRDHVNIAVLGRVTRDIDTFLKNKYHVDLKEKLGYTFDRDVKINILGVSTSTRVAATDSKGRKISDSFVFEERTGADAAKHRIIEPFLFLLVTLGLVPALLPDGRVVVRKNGKEEAVKQEEVPKAQPNGKKNSGNTGKSGKAAKKPGFFARLFGRKNK